ncbi:ATP-binding protein [Streptomyces sp. NPDC057257]|uniref:ATP-binding protein n=1 Tax=Streptomyces sp. NPDC057257 TaxID=3346071 RepID=UPI003626C8DA
MRRHEQGWEAAGAADAEAAARQWYGDGSQGTLQFDVSRTDTSSSVLQAVPASAVVSRTGGLPAALTSFVGRRQELAEIGRLLETARLVTLTGAGGVGKTRLALEAAALSTGGFPDGVWLVDLAPLRETGAERVAGVAATALRVPDLGTPNALGRLAEHLSERRALIVLDNCEHLADACAAFAKSLLAASPELHILATSRHTLGVTGEHVLTVPPLPSDDAVVLLRDRATAVRPDLRGSDMDQVQLSRLCSDLDGLPLAIELAASRLRTLTVDQVVDRLEDRFALLTGGCRTALPHRRTLRGMIDWSHELCAPAERLLWQRLSVFAGGFSLEAAEGVCAGDGIEEREVADLLDRLVGQSIVLTCRSGHLPRYRMLETIRQYGRERLAGSGAEETLLRRHHAYFLALAEDIDASWLGPDQVANLARLRTEHTNLLAALDNDVSPGSGLALAGALRHHWCAGGFLGEGRHQLDRLLAAAPEATLARGRALWVAAWVAQTQGDLAAADRWLDEAEVLGERLDDPTLRAYARGFRGVSAHYRGRPDEAIPCYEDARAALAALGDEAGADFWLLALACSRLRADAPHAVETAEQWMSAAEARGERWGRARVLMTLGHDAWVRGDREAARALACSALDCMRGFNDHAMVARMLELLAWAASAEGGHGRAAFLLGVADSLWQIAGSTIAAFGPESARDHARCVERTVAALGPASYAEAFTEGSRYDDPGRALELPLDAPAPAGPGSLIALADATGSLSRREREVAALVTKGMTNRQIASALGFSPRTADRHVANILAKLGFGCRAQIAAWWTARQVAS